MNNYSLRFELLHAGAACTVVSVFDQRAPDAEPVLIFLSTRPDEEGAEAIAGLEAQALGVQHEATA